MNLNRTLFVLASAVTMAMHSSLTHAQRWVNIDHGVKEGPAVYADAESVGKSGSFLKAWFKYSFTTPQVGVKGVVFRSYLELALFDCQTRTQATQTVVFYAGAEPTGQAVDKVDFKPPSFSEPPPGTMSALQVMIICQSPLAR